MALDATSKGLLGTAVGLGALSIVGNQLKNLNSVDYMHPQKHFNSRKANKSLVTGAVGTLMAVPLLGAVSNAVAAA